MATPGFPVELQNTHPFVANGIAFAHNGALLPKADLWKLLTSDHGRPPARASDSELFFALIRQQTGELGNLYDGACSAVATLQDIFPKASLNAIILGREQMIVVHSSANAHLPTDYFTASGLSPADLPPDHLDRYFHMFYLRRPDGSTLFASTGIDLVGWRPLPPNSVTAVALGTLEMQIRTVPLGPNKSSILEELPPPVQDGAVTGEPLADRPRA
jgi:predicted glutamine amidotransferase